MVNNMVSSWHLEKKLFLVGHSMVSTIALTYAINHQDRLSGLILSGTTIEIKNSHSNLRALAVRTLAKILPGVGTIVLDASAMSRDKSVIDGYTGDPLVYRAKIPAILASELLAAISRLTGQLNKISIPILIMHDSSDRLSHPSGSRMVYNTISSPDKTLKNYDGLYHEIFNEPEYEQILSDVRDWLETRLKGPNF